MSNSKTTNPPVPDRDGRYSYDQLAQARLDTRDDERARIERIIEKRLARAHGAIDDTLLGSNEYFMEMARINTLDTLLAAICGGDHADASRRDGRCLGCEASGVPCDHR